MWSITIILIPKIESLYLFYDRSRGDDENEVFALLTPKREYFQVWVLVLDESGYVEFYIFGLLSCDWNSFSLDLQLGEVQTGKKLTVYLFLLFLFGVKCYIYLAGKTNNGGLMILQVLFLFCLKLSHQTYTK